DAPRLERRELYESFCAPCRIRCQADLTSSKCGIDLASEPRHGSDSVVMPHAIAANCADDRLSRMDADSHVDRLCSECRNRLSHTKRGVASAHSMVLLGDGRAEQRCHAIALNLTDRAPELADQFRHGRHDGIMSERGLGVRALDHLTDARAKHCELLAFRRRGGPSLRFQ